MINTKVHYRSSFSITKSVIASDQTLFRIILFQIGRWLQSHLLDTQEARLVFKKWFYSGGVLGSNKYFTSAEVKVITKDEIDKSPKIWVLKFQHRDSKSPERIWTAFFALSNIEESSVEMSVTVTWHLYPGFVGVEPPNPNYSVPRLVKQMLEYDELTIDVCGHKIDSKSKKIEVGYGRDLYNSIQSQSRSLPIVLLNIRDSADAINPDGLQNLLLGSALVYWYNDVSVHQELNYEWGRFANLYQCPSDSLRIYQSQVNKGSLADAQRHRFFSLQEYSTNIKLLLQILVESILRITSSRLGSGVIRDFDSLDSYLQTEKLHQLKQAASSETRSTEEAAYIEALEDETTKLAQQVYELKKDNEGYIEYQILYEETLKQYDTLKEQFGNISKGQKHLNELGKAQEDLRENLKKFPDSLEEVLTIISNLNRDKLVVLNEAYVSARDSEFDDLSSAWQVLMEMATILHDILFNGEEGNIEKAFKDKSNFYLSMKDSKLLKENAKMMSLRKREYEGAIIEIVPHVKCESRGKHLRVHFYVDGHRKLLVIGHFGDHLDTPGTKRRKE